MTAPQQRRRPSPHPPTITESDTAVCNADPTAPHHTTPDQQNQPTTLHPAITISKQTWEWLRTNIQPPTIFTEREPAVRQLREYAHRAAYTHSGPLRAVGIAWCYTAAIPTLVAARLWAWCWERPARFLITAATVKLLTFLPPVGWAADHLITPAVVAGLHLFL